MARITDGFKDIFLAGVGAMAMGAEKSKELIDQLIAKGEITVEQGKELNSELKHRAVAATADLRDDVIAAQMASMTREQREEFAARVAEMAAKANEKDAMQASEVEEVFAAEVAEADAAARAAKGEGENAPATA